jgi:hypothetical protein
VANILTQKKTLSMAVHPEMQQQNAAVTVLPRFFVYLDQRPELHCAHRTIYVNQWWTKQEGVTI